ncbi:flagellar export protein FliJ [Photobacterium sp. ZSDE20]|uniref:Flagellar FliJ protein n=1 Tax=Photobacterium pectinilyticum TaxID=2906793 RepID=A0ABT1MY81_9GAMM|nr:flagellar export protein FliJ [Photobacterium sp. ZSDE20]MCQ1057420.1 flagellar export protein FliJ [Photobacterium sp. ZSDE20]MDD1821631.1 flagellar export protein FliJ [Photobacterium sp. ZSDE20]
MAKQSKALDRFRQIRQGELEKLGQQFQKKQQDCANHLEKLEQLDALYDSCQVVAGETALAWTNRFAIRDHLKHLTEIQTQTLALSQAEQVSLKQHVVQQHVKVKSLESVIEKRRQHHDRLAAKSEQKLMDEMAMQRFIRPTF